ncbi:putative cytochrome p450, partial [Trypoxylus dichotomus]
EKISRLAHEIRAFVQERIVGDRLETLSADDEPQDYVESLIKQVKYGGEPALSWNTALFALEDIIGGHSAVANFLVKALAFLVKEPEVQERIQAEIDSTTSLGNNTWRKVCISDRNMMPYTEGTVFEVIRMIASAIVPRVSNQNSSVNGRCMDQLMKLPG